MVFIQIIDYFLFFNEFECLEIRLNTLDKYVDKFVICECSRTHQNNIRKTLFDINDPKFCPFKDRIVHIIIDDAPDTDERFRIENYHREIGVLRAIELLKLNDDDIIIISDIDEIPIPDKLAYAVQLAKDKNYLVELNQLYFNYFFNCLAKVNYENNTPWILKIGKYKSLPGIDGGKLGENKILPETIKDAKIDNGAWHFSFVGNPQKIIEKSRAYSHVEYNNFEFISGRIKKFNLIKNSKKKVIDNPLSLFTKKFEMLSKDDLRLPKYLIENYDKFKEFFALKD
ncbi:hypothetical protein KY345_04130 [Candidatus Woesearchaeota archaeon]|nr:hypothetical protein [Candidatus Woesearchaeota archaeon]